MMLASSKWQWKYDQWDEVNGTKKEAIEDN
jgi:hypothetical protein